jgi:DNA-binding LacI/PurR family transcriptional regulator
LPAGRIRGFDAAMFSEKRVSLQDVAKAAGVSAMTVSRALRGGGGISEEKRHHVLKHARKIGYKLDARMNELMAHIRAKTNAVYTGTIIFALGTATKGMTHNIHVSTKIHMDGARRRADARGYKLEPVTLPFDGSADKQIHRVLQARGIRGLIICPPEGEELSLAFDLTSYSSVVIGNALKNPSLHRVIHNHEGGMEVCIMELLRRGYRRIGFAIHDRADVNTHHEWVGAYLRHQHFWSRRDSVPIMHYDERRTPVDRAVMSWYEKYRPDAVISVGVEIKRLFERRGLNIPRDVGFVSLSVPECDDVVAGTTLNPLQAGALLVDSIITQVLSNESGVPAHAVESRVDPRWVDGSTVGWIAPKV